MPSCCCVPGCSTRGGLSFPKDEALKKQWINAIKRNSNLNKPKIWSPHPRSLVCHLHFKDEDFITETRYGADPLRRQRKPNSLPSVFPWNSLKTHEVEREKRYIARKRKFEESFDKKSDFSEIKLDNEQSQEQSQDMIISNVGCFVETSTCESDGQSVKCSESEPPPAIYTESSCQTLSMPILSIENFLNDNECFMFYTGLASYTDFLHVLYSLGEAAFHLNYIYNQVQNLTSENQLFLTLIKLRQYKTNFELSKLFSVSTTTVENIWLTWINFMSRQWREVNFWPDRDLVNHFAPRDFYSKFPTTRLIIDGTEIAVKKPKPPIAQQSTFSTYKKRNTVKVLVGSTPGGLTSFISPAYGGSASDRQLVERSPLLNLCEPGDSVMSDKGFNVQDLFASRDVTINIPTFLKSKIACLGKQ